MMLMMPAHHDADVIIDADVCDAHDNDDNLVDFLMCATLSVMVKRAKAEDPMTVSHNAD